MKKRGEKGVSTIIVTIILVALVLVAVGIVWAVIANIISKSSEDVGIEKFTLDTEIKAVGINGTDTEVQRQSTTIKELEEDVFIFTPQMNVSNVQSITLVPLIKSGEKETSGLEKSYNVDELGTISSGGGITCTPATCSALGYECGTWANGTCAGTLNCGSCGSGYSCNASGKCVQGCTPANCSALGYECGTWANGTCSGTLDCGNCSSGYSCNASGRCVSTCTPTTCSALGYECGIWANGTCAGTIYCGNCSPGYNCIAGSCVYQGSGIDPNLVLWVTFDDYNSTNFIDNSSYNHYLRFYGSELSTSDITMGIRGNAVIYNSSSTSYVYVSDSDLSLNFPCKSGTGTSYNLSVLLWVYPYHNSMDWLCKYSGSFCFWDGGSGVLREHATSTQSTQKVTLNQWNHIAMVYNGASMNLYLNGTLVANKAYTSGLSASSSNVVIGYAGDLYHGLIDEIRIYNKSLSQSEIQNFYNLQM
jgi:hypothetical protein